MRSIAIFGAGIAGLTVAHELCESFASEEFNIHIYEKSSNIGGFAKSSDLNISNCTFPTEHSWRGYAPFYFNTFDIMKKIPVNTDYKSSVYDNLTYPVHFLLPRDKLGNKIGEPTLTAGDVAVLGYHISKVILSSPERRKNVYASESFKDIVYPKLSPAGRDKVFGMIGPGLGLDLYTCSIYDVAKYAEMRFLTKHHSHKKYNRVGWHVMNAPTSKAWFDHWEKYLLQKGVHVHYNTELVDIIVNNNNIDGVNNTNTNLSVKTCIVKNNGCTNYVQADEYIFAINPFNFRDIISNNMLLQKDSELQKFVGLCADGEHKQIAFQIAFDKKINFGKVFTNHIQETYAVAFPDSEFNITLYPQDKQFKPTDLPTPGYWSGTACICTRPGKLYNLPAVNLTKKQFIREVKYQIFRSEEFKLMIDTWNHPLELADFNIVEFIVYPEWKFPPEVTSATEQERKWVTTINTEPYRPNSVCDFDNLFLSGAHTRTSVSLWSMEGAVESGKITARHVLSKYNLPLSSLHTHSPPVWLSVFHKPDNLLHKIGAPNILVICAILIMIIILCIIYHIFNH
jgi:hypothetical protein